MEVQLRSMTYGTDRQTPEECIEFAARVCYRSTHKMGTDLSFVEKRIKQGHLGVLEHAHASFYLTGVSRALSHQLVRHRLFSYCQESQRLVSAKEANCFVLPISIAGKAEAKEAYLEHMDHVQKTMDKLLELGVPKEDARFVLPNATATSIVASGNFRVWFEFFKERLNKPAQWEIKEMSRLIWNTLRTHAPTVFTRENLECVPLKDYSILG